ncbi:MAG: hypothetical protein ABSD85_06720 [Acidimicrobiales bacterium]
MSLSTHTSGAVVHANFTSVRRHGHTVAVVLMVATSAVATFDLLLFAASAIR